MEGLLDNNIVQRALLNWTNSRAEQKEEQEEEATGDTSNKWSLDLCI